MKVLAKGIDVENGAPNVKSEAGLRAALLRSYLITATGIFLAMMGSTRLHADEWVGCPPTHPKTLEFNEKIYCIDAIGNKILLPNSVIPDQSSIEGKESFQKRAIPLDIKVQQGE